MRFLIDQDVYATTSKLLGDLGHDVVTARELSLHDAQDVELLLKAAELDRIMVTRDRDYGWLSMQQLDIQGIIYLRIEPTTVQSVHDELTNVLSTNAEAVLKVSFTVIEPGRHRIRKLFP
jgi:predicted nuclease of predicted toxin-antitoxin system